MICETSPIISGAAEAAHNEPADEEVQNFVPINISFMALRYLTVHVFVYHSSVGQHCMRNLFERNCI